MVLYPNKLPESERVCFGICKLNIILTGLCIHQYKLVVNMALM